ncbi:UDP-2,4-diacetamido-2,4,6-trideoxy-beta-L-altropyranose hydrolase [Aliarcobacter butzleri]|uniref:UDP-2,4-diacetamido-2,4, 6-trideoxy-beta-L-altropyranose hydrolase n=1 Tax=Aliarcobacter butzleri TaxID=28197 RepID=UPI001EE0C8F5|nr:UDP-2,4-diacetamido-2,4,6-trideoxy-beta-L-altropyranose hydrolase [Aliarcobacter butzleri]MCG3697880.1 UDP-2,4-diacetamido-2,4,6-trideoxy-beta-L-altropyranose hydrolase [Aliarcobacter butzleri]MCG3699880.1 UDP-2,4-diacetamido-2,4,6-trideoxy-beta-L-altropyranose hydrolase [Aliarcobacter butzleri]MCT7620069.1 UDP-2,4-diacetamido-2,4,6-trideoxy-beta-L-altropyranose hydrolase [Aliarcobacter butzleri]MDN5080570.1 UDP-2,4-diacetamido-2,4,6-trideoxy-beta-L-altropyranose hydrolase [Aliarcobacter but
MNILIRADSSSYIGTGHIMRDLVLAKQYKNENIIFATQDLVGNINHKIKESNYNIEILNNNNFEELNKLIKKLNIDMIIIDHYEINYNFEKKLKEQNSKLKIFVFDDTYEKHYCDILLNHNIYADEKKYRNLVPKDCELKCGTNYTLLREEFLEAKKQKQTIKKENRLKTLFIAMGGADHKNLNITILKNIKIVCKKNIKVNLVTTTANRNLEKLKRYCKDKEWINLHINSKEVANLMNQSDFAIITPSVTANEAYFLNLPFIAIKTAKNQKQMYKFLKRNNYFILKKFNESGLKKYLKLFMEEKIENR